METTHGEYGSFVRWATKLPLVDAGMKELAQTGYCSNRKREPGFGADQNLNIDWRIGVVFKFCSKGSLCRCELGQLAVF
jgi:deoxyribodipyrimidine photolyase